MGRAAGAALTMVAPEAKLATAAAGKAAGAGGRRGPAAADPRVSAPGSKAARQRGDIESIKARRPAAAPVQPDDVVPQEPAPADPPPVTAGGGSSLPAMPPAASAGSGFLLGVFAWAVGLAYLQGGSAGVKKFLAAKFFNKA